MSRSAEILCEHLMSITVQIDFCDALKNFLERFRVNSDLTQLRDEPRLLSNLIQNGGYAVAFAASTAAYLCQVHDLKAPAWVNKKCRIMSTPWFATKSPNMKAIHLQEPPAAFHVRNLFVSANALSRA
jgi:hypothetical protein